MRRTFFLVIVLVIFVLFIAPTLIADDNRGGVDTLEFILTAIENHSPEISSPMEGQEYSVTAGSVLSFDIEVSDPDGDALTLSASNMPANAVFDTSKRTFTWTPAQSDTGTYVITFSAEDVHGCQGHR